MMTASATLVPALVDSRVLKSTAAPTHHKDVGFVFWKLMHKLMHGHTLGGAPRESNAAAVEREVLGHRALDHLATQIWA